MDWMSTAGFHDASMRMRCRAPMSVKPSLILSMRQHTRAPLPELNSTRCRSRRALFAAALLVMNMTAPEVASATRMCCTYAATVFKTASRDDTTTMRSSEPRRSSRSSIAHACILPESSMSVGGCSGVFGTTCLNSSASARFLPSSRGACTCRLRSRARRTRADSLEAATRSCRLRCTFVGRHSSTSVWQLGSPRLSAWLVRRSMTSPATRVYSLIASAASSLARSSASARRPAARGLTMSTWNSSSVP
mmetsp:Transcript_40694/g.95026  ORF Transcript_40694/g.95026 Transcript_40694/m.95026 type:complete len:249 (-) Transcript_40694:1033-1779(-)